MNRKDQDSIWVCVSLDAWAPSKSATPPTFFNYTQELPQMSWHLLLLLRLFGDTWSMSTTCTWANPTSQCLL